jgi:hypothetical protein
MKQIEPVSLWVNGQQRVANAIDLRSVSDNLKNSATFYYALISELVQEDGTTTIESLAQGNLSIGGQEYIDWGLNTDVNQWAYEWAAKQLNLVLVVKLAEVFVEGKG